MMICPTRSVVLWACTAVICTGWAKPAIALIASERFALVFGNNTGRDEEKSLQYAQSDAQRFYQVITEVGGFSRNQSVLLLDADADEVWDALHTLETKMQRLKRETGQKTMLVIYYSGHANGESLELGDSELHFDHLLAFIKKSKFDVRLAFVDSCKSGRLINTKHSGASSETEFFITGKLKSKGYAVITSSAYNELSQESAEMRGAFFTHYLVSALRGAADTSGDGRVTILEAYNYAYTRTIIRTSRTIAGSQHPMYEFKLSGAGDVVLTEPAHSRSVPLSVQWPESGRLVLLDGRGQHIVAELDVEADTISTLYVQEGNYMAYLVTDDNQVRYAETHVGNQYVAVLDHNAFQTVSLETAVTKGGLFLDENAMSHGDRWRHSVGTGAMWRKFPTDDAISSYGAMFSFRSLAPSQWKTAVVVNWTTKNDVWGEDTFHSVGVLAGGGYVWLFPFIGFRLEVLAGFEEMWQVIPRAENQYTSGFNYIGVFGVEVPIGKYFSMNVDAAVGGRLFRHVKRGWISALDSFVSVGMAWGLPIR